MSRHRVCINFACIGLFPDGILDFEEIRFISRFQHRREDQHQFSGGPGTNANAHGCFTLPGGAAPAGAVWIFYNRQGGQGVAKAHQHLVEHYVI